MRRKTTKDDDEEVYETELSQLFSEEDEVQQLYFLLMNFRKLLYLQKLVLEYI